MAINIDRKVALVTGASSGMGADFVRELLKEGYVVYGVARRLERMVELKKIGAEVLKMDITVEEDIVNVVRTIEEKHGGVDVLVNNAGFGMYGAMEDTTLDDARYQFEVNLFGLARLTQLVLPYMRRQKAGKVINISSIGGKIYSPLGAWYHATKHALEGWSDCLRIEVEQFGIDVVVNEPGAIRTEFGDVVLGPMLERSANGPYAKLARGMEKTMHYAENPNLSSDPKVITDKLLKAVRSRKPRTRYWAGRGSSIMLFMRRWFSDRCFDRAVSLMAR